jgi:hypothetical protein
MPRPLKKQGLKLNGKPFDLETPSPAALRAVAILSKLPPDELLDMHELAKRAQFSAWSGNGSLVIRSRALEPYTHKYRNRHYFGSETAIQELRRRISEAR